MKISYFINQCPKVSRTFISREILALERQGYDVQRIALRGWDENTEVDIDIRKSQSTYYLLQYDLVTLLRAMFKKAITNRYDLEFLGRQQYLSLCESGAT